jgi:hypothetical protein
LIPKFASEDAAKVCEFRNRETNAHLRMTAPPLMEPEL